MADKCTEPLSTKVPEDLAVAFRKRARAAGCTPADLLRDLICHLEHGLTFGELETNDRRRALNLQALGEPPTGSRNSE
jgi:hypothetical protein